MFLYIFENGSIDQRLAMPDADDVSAIGNGLLSVIKLSEYRFVSLNEEGEWEEVEGDRNRYLTEEANHLNR